MRSLIVKSLLCLTFIFLLTTQTVFSQADSTLNKVLQFSIGQEIMPGAWRITQKAFAQAKEMQADYILLRLNTYGGALDIADSIRTKFLNSNIPTIVFIDNNAASAGALISIACDKIYMVKSATIGAATVVNQTGEAMPDKYQSYMRGIMRATAESKGRDPIIAEAMVDDRIYIPGVIDSGKVLTFTTTEAMQHGFCDGEAANIKEVLQLAGIENYAITQYELSSVEKIIQVLLSPTLNGILLLIIIGGIYFELQSPGVGFPIIASAVAAILYFAPLYLEGLAANWEILLFIAGLILISVEIFIIPGVGAIGILGVLMALTGLTLSMIGNNYFDFTFTPPGNISSALLRISIVIIFIFTLPLMLNHKFINSRLFKKIMLTESTSNEAGYTTKIKEYDLLIGLTGKSLTDLKPVGKIIINNEIQEASTDGEHIDRNTAVVVKRISNNVLIVKA